MPLLHKSLVRSSSFVGRRVTPLLLPPPEIILQKNTTTATPETHPLPFFFLHSICSLEQVRLATLAPPACVLDSPSTDSSTTTRLIRDGCCCPSNLHSIHAQSQCGRAKAGRVGFEICMICLDKATHTRARLQPSFRQKTNLVFYQRC